MLISRRAAHSCSFFFFLIALMAGGSTHASCISAPDARVRELQQLVDADPNRAVARADAMLLSQGKDADPKATAWLHAVRAQAFSALELDSDARVAAAEGLRLVPDDRQAVHVALTSIDAENVYGATSIAAAIQSIEKLRTTGGLDSDIDVCLLITLGTLQYRHNHADLAIPTLMQAYRAAVDSKGAEQRVLAADALSSVMREIGDYHQALTLSSEVVEWRRSRNQSLALSVALYLRGNILMDMREYAEAGRAFADARALSVQVNDTQGVAFSDMRICEVKIELGEFASAREACRSAFETFSASKTMDLVAQTRALQAHIDLAQGDATRALATLDGILANDAAVMIPRNVPPLFKLRASANAARGKYAAAYADLNEYTDRIVRTNEARRVRQIDGMRARFETDRQIERNASLQDDLERSRLRQVELQRLTVIAIGASVLVIGLLTAMLWNARRHRRQLAALASLDSLTALPNRRHTAQLAAAAIANAEASNQPLTIALIDLDHFKAINDQYGHAGGDQVLREFARVSRNVLRGTDTFGRWGGEEFLLVMPDTPLDLAVAIVERLRCQSREIVLADAKADFTVSLSAGLATTGPAPNSLDGMIALADIALYRAKNEGRNMVQIDAASMEAASSGVRRAIARGR